MEEVFQFLRKCGAFFLATEEGKQPRVRPFGVVEIYEGKLYFLTGAKKKVAKQIEKNPKVEICAAIGEEWVRIQGEMVVDERVEAQKYFLDHNPQLRGMYHEGDGNTQVMYIKNATATFESFVREAKTVKF